MSGAKDKQAERLQISSQKLADGFKIAEEDLRLRGPGQFLGKKQSGMSDLYMANLHSNDIKLLQYTQTRDLATAAFYRTMQSFL